VVRDLLGRWPCRRQQSDDGKKEQSHHIACVWPNSCRTGCGRRDPYRPYRCYSDFFVLPHPGVFPGGRATCVTAQIKASDPVKLSSFHR
jgi:hypothetical protein